MLVLSREIGEKLVIDGNIIVQVVKIEGHRITLGFEAPADVRILRSELSQKRSCQPASPKPSIQDGLLATC